MYILCKKFHDRPPPSPPLSLFLFGTFCAQAYAASDGFNTSSWDVPEIDHTSLVFCLAMQGVPRHRHIRGALPSTSTRFSLFQAIGDIGDRPEWHAFQIFTRSDLIEINFQLNLGALTKLQRMLYWKRQKTQSANNAIEARIGEETEHARCSVIWGSCNSVVSRSTFETTKRWQKAIGPARWSGCLQMQVTVLEELNVAVADAVRAFT